MTDELRMSPDADVPPDSPLGAQHVSVSERDSSSPTSGSARTPRGLMPLAALTILLSAFLLFQAQPLVSKAILPWFGGSPAVWSTSMLFFQVLLLAGYAYADRLVRVRSKRTQLLVHAALLVAAISLLPITPSDRWKPTDGEFPTERILQVLAVSVGVPYLLVSTTGPLVQAWVARATWGASPYRLYALSNVGSLAALVTYPFFFERYFEVPVQAWIWSAGFVAFALLCAATGWRVVRCDDGRESIVGEVKASEPLSWAALPAWFFLPGLAVVTLLAVTNHLCRDVAVVPFLWIAPLTVYLLTFIICFDREAWYARRIWTIAGMAASLLVLAVMLAKNLDVVLGKVGLTLNLAAHLRNVLVEGSVYLVWLFIACMVCHGELVRRKPAVGRLTTFYLCVAAGGAMGGFVVAFLCPRVFSDHWELYGAVGAVFCVIACVLAIEGHRRGGRRKAAWIVFLIATGAGGFCWTWAVANTFDEGVIAKVRNFYGVLTVQEHYQDDPLHHGYALYNGRILHGFQYVDPERRRLPITYYSEDSGPGIVIERLRKLKGALRFGVIGLGTGTMAAHGRPGDFICFYEIDPNVIAIQDRYFAYLKDCEAEKRIEVGDARIQMERQSPQRFDALFIDAFSGDAVPTHLLTREALATYRRHLKPDGVAVFHISNRYLELQPVILGLARDAKLGLARFYRESDISDLYDTSSDWVAVTDSKAFLEDEVVAELQAGFTDPRSVLWTDRYSNLWEVLD
ncbi:MAG: hypothetical protein FJ297_17235 [Planctomycetes bacterium]|nr:hypothetical protein [Planctomycetota bacterium]